MDLPNHSGTCSNECDVTHSFFVGLCYNCNSLGTPTQPLKRCSGCLLVSYCSRKCQKEHRSLHKYVCKEFTVVNGKSVLHSTGPWEEHIACLRERTARLPCPEDALCVFHNPRVCNTCKEASPDRLTDCKCASVSYCSKQCDEADKQHQEACKLLAQIAQIYSLKYICDPNLKERLFSYPMSLIDALYSLDKQRFGCDQLLLKEITTLTVHVLTSWPMFDRESWHGFINKLPKLKELNIVFVMQENALNSSFKLSFKLSGLSCYGDYRCQPCLENNQTITFSVQQMLYHMFFSSPQYTEPDVVVIFGNAQEMVAGREYDTHSEMSYRNMIYSQHTILVLTDEDLDMLALGVRAVNNARPVDQIWKPMTNTLTKHGMKKIKNRDISNMDHDEINYITCLKRS